MRAQVVLALGAMVSSLFVAQPAYADHQSRGYDNYEQGCRQDRRDRTAGGAVIGAIIGGVLGSNVAANGNRTEGTILGGVLGGAAGAAIARNSSQRCNPEPEGDGYYQNGYGQEAYDCQWRNQSYRDQRGRWRQDQVYMCRDQNGDWYRAEQ